jgi:hypothetical protein
MKNVKNKPYKAIFRKGEPGPERIEGITGRILMTGVPSSREIIEPMHQRLRFLVANGVKSGYFDSNTEMSLEEGVTYYPSKNR